MCEDGFGEVVGLDILETSESGRRVCLHYDHVAACGGIEFLEVPGCGGGGKEGGYDLGSISYLTWREEVQRRCCGKAKLTSIKSPPIGTVYIPSMSSLVCEKGEEGKRTHRGCSSVPIVQLLDLHI